MTRTGESSVRHRRRRPRLQEVRQKYTSRLKILPCHLQSKGRDLDTPVSVLAAYNGRNEVSGGCQPAGGDRFDRGLDWQSGNHAFRRSMIFPRLDAFRDWTVIESDLGRWLASHPTMRPPVVSSRSASSGRSTCRAKAFHDEEELRAELSPTCRSRRRQPSDRDRSSRRFAAMQTCLLAAVCVLRLTFRGEIA